MSDKSTALMAQINILQARRDNLTERLEVLFNAVQREDLRETTASARESYPALTRIVYLFGDDATTGWAHRLIDTDGADIPGWEQTITPEGQMLQDAFPCIDAATPVDDLIAQGGVHTWEFAELDVDRILAL